MLALISYSLDKEELYVIPAISELLKDNFAIEATNNSDSKYIENFENYSKIKSCSLFIGLASLRGEKGHLVREQFRIANKNNVPSLFFEEVNEASDVDITSDNEVRYLKGSEDKILSKIESKKTQIISDFEGMGGFLDKNELAWIISGDTASHIITWMGKSFPTSKKVAV